MSLKNTSSYIIACLILGGSCMLHADSKTEADKKMVRMSPVASAVAKVFPSVVNLSTERIVNRGYSPWGATDPFSGSLDDFYEQQRDNAISLGCGSIISQDGLIVTNAHVVHRASRITVNMSDGRNFQAKEIASDDLNDIALLKITDLPTGQKLQPIDTAAPGDLILGETVIAVGNPFGLGSTVSQGVLSATGRNLVLGGKTIFSDLIQTDAGIYPGNSGGPLININGEMIGMNTAVMRDAQIGFAIPLDRIENLLARWLTPERFTDSSLGIIPVYKKNKSGAYEVSIENVIPGSPAEKAGLKKGQIIKAFNGTSVTDLMKFSQALMSIKPEQRISITCDSNPPLKLTAEKAGVSDGKTLAERKIGITVQELTPSMAEALKYPFDGGLIISNITEVEADINRGDLLVRLGDTPLYKLADLSRALQNKHYGDVIDGVVISVKPVRGRLYLIKKNVNFTIR